MDRNRGELEATLRSLSGEIRDLEELLEIHVRNQRKLKIQLAGLGIAAPNYAYLRNQLEDEGTAVLEAEQKLKVKRDEKERLETQLKSFEDGDLTTPALQPALVESDSLDLKIMWTIVGLVLFFLTFTFYYQTQWNIPLPGFRGVEGEDTYEAAIWGMIFCGPLLAWQVWLSQTYALRSKGETWRNRIPIFGRLNPPLDKPEMRVLQGITLFAFVVFPTIAQIHFPIKFFSGTATKNGVKIAVGVAHLMAFEYMGDAFSGQYKYGSVYYFPIWEPWFFLIGEVVLLRFVFRSMHVVFSPKN